MVKQIEKILHLLGQSKDIFPKKPSVLIINWFVITLFSSKSQTMVKGLLELVESQGLAWNQRPIIKIEQGIEVVLAILSA